MSHNWMEHAWPIIGGESLLHVTMPGSHNSGNIPGNLTFDKHIARMDRDWYRPYDYFRTLNQDMTDKEYQNAAISWMYHQELQFADQLKAGARFFHLRTWNSAQDNTTASIDTTWHHAPGFISDYSMRIMLQDIVDFLHKNPYEFVVLGLNNHRNFEPSAEIELYKDIINFIGHDESGLDMITADDLGSSLQELKKNFPKKIFG